MSSFPHLKVENVCLHVHIWSVLEDGLPNNPYVPLRLHVSSCNQKWPLVGLPSRLPVLHTCVLCLPSTSLSNTPTRAHKYGEENGSNANAKFVQHHMHIRKPFGQSLPFWNECSLIKYAEEAQCKF